MKKFEVRYDPETIKQAIEKQRDSIIDQQIVRQAELEGIENRTKLILVFLHHSTRLILTSPVKFGRLGINFLVSH
ncbi:MAG: hypothetical protein ABIK93_02575 [candidate division WOR-3 bacterium]